MPVKYPFYRIPAPSHFPSWHDMNHRFGRQNNLLPSFGTSTAIRLSICCHHCELTDCNSACNQCSHGSRAIPRRHDICSGKQPCHKGSPYDFPPQNIPLQNHCQAGFHGVSPLQAINMAWSVFLVLCSKCSSRLLANIGQKQSLRLPRIRCRLGKSDRCPN